MMNKVEIESSIKYYVGLIMKNFVLEFNDQFNRDKVVYKIRNFLAILMDDCALDEFKVSCDENNNTPEVIDANQLKVSVYIKYFDNIRNDHVLKNIHFTLKPSDKKDDNTYKFMIDIFEEEFIETIITTNTKNEHIYLR